MLSYFEFVNYKKEFLGEKPEKILFPGFPPQLMARGKGRLDKKGRK
jgi:hypothetical protein